MKSFTQFLLEASDSYHSIDSLSLLNAIEKDSGQLEYFKTLLGDRKMFVSELEILAKENKLNVEDFNNIYLQFHKKYGVFQDIEEE